MEYVEVDVPRTTFLLKNNKDDETNTEVQSTLVIIPSMTTDEAHRLPRWFPTNMLNARRTVSVLLVVGIVQSMIIILF